MSAGQSGKNKKITRAVRSHRFTAKLPFWTKPTHICPAAIVRVGNVNWLTPARACVLFSQHWKT
jgi:hypothetical protein